MDLIFHYDIVCPYAYLASTQVAALAERRGARLVWSPVLLGGIYRSIGAPQVPAATWAPQKAVLDLVDLHRQAERLGVPLRFPAAHPQRTVEAMRMLVAAPPDERPALTAALYAAYWVEERDITDPAVLDAIARQVGVDPAARHTPAARQGLFDTTARAVEAGAFGVPTFELSTSDGQSSVARGRRIWWGGDRLHLVEQALGGERPASAAPGPAGAATTLRFIHDFASPFSYLASTQVAALAERHGARLVWHPILLGALFKEIGTPNVPMLAMNPARQRYVRRDLDDWAAWWGVDFSWPSTFPVRTVLPLRVSILEPRAVGPLYRALWVEDRDIGQPEVVAEVLAAGLDPTLIDRAGEARRALRENTAAAIALGACGVPSFHLEHRDPERPELERPELASMLVWGQDRLELVGHALAGWRPAL